MYMRYPVVWLPATVLYLSHVEDVGLSPSSEALAGDNRTLDRQ